MDLLGTINYLILQKERLDHAIAQLEALQDPNQNYERVVSKKRGRKSMGDAERAQVSERMRKYWADRKRQGEMTASAAG